MGIMAKQVEELEKEKKELQVRLKAQEKKQDHIERAKRVEELPLLKLQHDEFKEESKLLWEEQEKERIEEDKRKRASDVANRDRMKRDEIALREREEREAREAIEKERK